MSALVSFLGKMLSALVFLGKMLSRLVFFLGQDVCSSFLGKMLSALVFFLGQDVVCSCFLGKYVWSCFLSWARCLPILPHVFSQSFAL